MLEISQFTPAMFLRNSIRRTLPQIINRASFKPASLARFYSAESTDTVEQITLNEVATGIRSSHNSRKSNQNAVQSRNKKITRHSS